METITVSSPGKVLLSGAYLILDQPNEGLVLTTTARIYSTVHWEHISQPDSSNSSLWICIHSPQFREKWHYNLHIHEDSLTNEKYCFLEKNKAFVSSDNHYIECAVYCCMNTLLGLLGETFLQQISRAISQDLYLNILIQADNDFYSQVEQLQLKNFPLSRSSLSSLPNFLPFLCDENGAVLISKTGMGSSAALITSIVGSLLGFFQGVKLGLNEDNLTVDELSSSDLHLIHRLAQVCHCSAQGKIGSGFDVSAACFGTQKYVRFSPQPLKSLLNSISLKHVLPSLLIPALSDHSSWDYNIQPFALPTGLHLIMGDISAGSNTVSMVRQVLNWRETEPEEASTLFKNLAHQNEKLGHLFQHLNQSLNKMSSYEAVLLGLARQNFTNWLACPHSIGPICANLRSCFLSIRQLLKKIGEKSGVAIEPDEQTNLLKSTMELPGVVFAGVPGAGGRDAIFALVLHQSVLENVETLWLSLSSKSLLHENRYTVCPLLLDLDLCQGKNGLKFSKEIKTSNRT